MPITVFDNIRRMYSGREATVVCNSAFPPINTIRRSLDARIFYNHSYVTVFCARLRAADVSIRSFVLF